MNEETNPTPEQKPVGRRAFMADLAAVGAVLLGSMAWATSARTVEAGPTPVPQETDRVLPPGAPPPPRPTTRPSASPRPHATSSARPREGDRVPPAGSVPAPPPKELDTQAKPGRVAAPPPKESETHAKPGEMVAPRTPSPAPKPSQTPKKR